MSIERNQRPTSWSCTVAVGGPLSVLRIGQRTGVDFPSAATVLRWQGRTVLYSSRLSVGNGYIESFNNRLRRECLNRNHWNTLFEARVVIGDFTSEHNRRHRHSALGYRTPAEYAAACRHTHTPAACEIT